MSCLETLTGSKILLDRLRKVSLAYHYDRNNKIYPQGFGLPFHTKFGQSPQCYSKHLVTEVIFFTGKVFYESYVHEASIVNYYEQNTNLGSFIDESVISKRALLIFIKYDNIVV